jgi:REP element-mobilizing transposase RayT
MASESRAAAIDSSHGRKPVAGLAEELMGHTYCSILVHVIFTTKDRRPLISRAFRDRLHRYMAGVARHEFGSALAVGGTEDHAHALLSVRASVSTAEAVRKLKSLSSGWVHRTIPDALDFEWQPGYAAFSVSQSDAAVVREYIESQAKHHERRTFENELARLLKGHGLSPVPGDQAG